MLGWCISIVVLRAVYREPSPQQAERLAAYVFFEGREGLHLVGPKRSGQYTLGTTLQVLCTVPLFEIVWMLYYTVHMLYYSE